MSVSASILARELAAGEDLFKHERVAVGAYVAELEQALTEASKALETANASLQVSVLTVRALTQRIPDLRPPSTPGGEGQHEQETP